MVMVSQPDGIRRVRRATIEDAHGRKINTEYTIFYGPPARQPAVMIGYTQRRVSGSVSRWRAYPSDGGFPADHRSHTEAVAWLLEVFRAAEVTGDAASGGDDGAVHADRPPERPGPPPGDPPDGGFLALRVPEVTRAEDYDYDELGDPDPFADDPLYTP